MLTIAVLQLTAALSASNAAPTGGDWFDDADANGDEVLTIQEIASVLPAITRARFQAIDQNRDGTLDYDEFEDGVDQGYLHKR